MKKSLSKIILGVILICVVAVCFLTNHKNKQDLSFLNYENLVSIVAQSDTLSVLKVGDESSNYIIDGLQLAQFLDTANWNAQIGFSRNVQRDTEQNSKASIQIKLDGIYLKVFDTDTANIYDETTGKDRYYQMSNEDYEKILTMLSLETH